MLEKSIQFIKDRIREYFEKIIKLGNQVLPRPIPVQVNTRFQILKKGRGSEPQNWGSLCLKTRGPI